MRLKSENGYMGTQTSNNRNDGTRVEGETFSNYYKLDQKHVFFLYEGAAIFGIAQSTAEGYEVRFFHVQRRDANTLLAIIWKHIYPGSRIW